MNYYKLKICEEYWTIQKTVVDCRNSDKYEGKSKVLISPRGRASFHLTDIGALRVYTDKTTRDYFSDKEFADLQNKYVSYEKDDKTYYCSVKIENLIPLIPNISEECNDLLKILKNTKIQKSHKHKFSSNFKNDETDDFFGIFNDDEL